MKKTIFSLLVVSVLLLMIFSSCGSDTTTSTTSTPTTSTPLQTTSSPTSTPDKTWDLKYATWGGGTSPIAALQEEWAQRISERTNGRVNIKIYWGETLMKSTEHLQGVQSGIADMCSYTYGQNPGYHQLNLFVSIPGMGWPSMAEGREIYFKLMDKYPELEEENGPMKMIEGRFMPEYHLHTVNTPVRVPEDMRGMKLLARGDDYINALAKVDASAVAVTPGDFYMSLERGMAEGQFLHFPALDSFGLTELINYHTLLGPSGIAMAWICSYINMDVWNSFPPDIQQIILEVSDWYDTEAMKMDETLKWDILEESKAKGTTVIEVTEEEFQLWYELFEGSHDNWLADCEAKGFTSAKVIYDDCMNMIEEYKNK